MPAFERAPYNAMSSKPKNGNDVSSKSKNYTSFGVSFDEIDRKILEDKQQARNMELEIEDMLVTAQNNKSKLKLHPSFFPNVHGTFDRSLDVHLSLLQHVVLHVHFERCNLPSRARHAQVQPD